MNRRDFLHPRRLARTTGHVLGAMDELKSVEEPELSEDFVLLRIARRAMATRFEIMLPFGTPDAVAMGEAALDEIDRLEAQLTVYRPTSEVSRLNELAPLLDVPVEESLFQLLALAARIHQDSEDAYDITAGALIKAW